jgi:hypothetical protein
VWWMQVQETMLISNPGRWPCLSLVTHLTINNSGSNLVHELRHDLGILITSHIIRILDAIRCVSELVFDSFQDTGGFKYSTPDGTKRVRNN